MENNNYASDGYEVVKNPEELKEINMLFGSQPTKIDWKNKKTDKNVSNELSGYELVTDKKELRDIEKLFPKSETKTTETKTPKTVGKNVIDSGIGGVAGHILGKVAGVHPIAKVGLGAAGSYYGMQSKDKPLVDRAKESGREVATAAKNFVQDLPKNALALAGAGLVGSRLGIPGIFAGGYGGNLLGDYLTNTGKELLESTLPKPFVKEVKRVSNELDKENPKAANFGRIGSSLFGASTNSGNVVINGSKLLGDATVRGVNASVSGASDAVAQTLSDKPFSAFDLGVAVVTGVLFPGMNKVGAGIFNSSNKIGHGQNPFSTSNPTTGQTAKTPEEREAARIANGVVKGKLFFDSNGNVIVGKDYKGDVYDILGHKKGDKEFNKATPVERLNVLKEIGNKKLKVDEVNSYINNVVAKSDEINTSIGAAEVNPVRASVDRFVETSNSLAKKGEVSGATNSDYIDSVLKPSILLHERMQGARDAKRTPEEQAKFDDQYNELEKSINKLGAMQTVFQHYEKQMLHSPTTLEQNKSKHRMLRSEKYIARGLSEPFDKAAEIASDKTNLRNYELSAKIVDAVKSNYASARDLRSQLYDGKMEHKTVKIPNKEAFDRDFGNLLTDEEKNRLYNLRSNPYSKDGSIEIPTLENLLQNRKEHYDMSMNEKELFVVELQRLKKLFSGVEENENTFDSVMGSIKNKDGSRIDNEAGSFIKYKDGSPVQYNAALLNKIHKELNSKIPNNVQHPNYSENKKFVKGEFLDVINKAFPKNKGNELDDTFKAFLEVKKKVDSLGGIEKIDSEIKANGGVDEITKAIANRPKVLRVEDSLRLKRLGELVKLQKDFDNKHDAFDKASYLERLNLVRKAANNQHGIMQDTFRGTKLASDIVNLYKNGISSLEPAQLDTILHDINNMGLNQRTSFYEALTFNNERPNKSKANSEPTVSGSELIAAITRREIDDLKSLLLNSNNYAADEKVTQQSINRVLKANNKIPILEEQQIFATSSKKENRSIVPPYGDLQFRIALALEPLPKDGKQLTMYERFAPDSEFRKVLNGDARQYVERLIEVLEHRRKTPAYRVPMGSHTQHLTKMEDHLKNGEKIDLDLVTSIEELRDVLSFVTDISQHRPSNLVNRAVGIFTKSKKKEQNAQNKEKVKNPFSEDAFILFDQHNKKKSNLLTKPLEESK